MKQSVNILILAQLNKKELTIMLMSIKRMVIWGIGTGVFIALISGFLPSKNELIAIHTPYGTMKVKLYDETPLHKANFLSLVDSGYYDSTLFHRVISSFMIQGGDPDSRRAKAGKKLGDGGPGYTIPAEFVPGIFHKRGVIAAARMGDDVNPSKASSGSQFYIVQGKVFSEQELQEMEERTNQMRKQKAVMSVLQAKDQSEFRAVYMQAMASKSQVQIDSLTAVMEKKAAANWDSIKLTPKQIELYSTIGGTPHLDGSYTVFGEVVSGLEILDSIAAQPVDGNNRPKQDVWMTMEMVEK